VPLTIVAGTGRCGSTMLSRVLQVHPDVLSISEFWSVFPHAELVRLASFLGVPAEKHWLDEAKKFTDPEGVSRAVTKLHPFALAEVRTSCVSGKRAYEHLKSQHAAATNASS
jgi:hypothetical protein